MNEQDFLEKTEQSIASIQDAIDDSGADIDYDEIDGVLTLEFDNGSKIVFSKQIATKQLWMATKTGGFHFDFDLKQQKWHCDSGEGLELYDMLSSQASLQAGERVQLKSPI